MLARGWSPHGHEGICIAAICIEPGVPIGRTPGVFWEPAAIQVDPDEPAGRGEGAGRLTWKQGARALARAC